MKMLIKMFNKTFMRTFINIPTEIIVELLQSGEERSNINYED